MQKLWVLLLLAAGFAGDIPTAMSGSRISWTIAGRLSTCPLHLPNILITTNMRWGKSIWRRIWPRSLKNRALTRRLYTFEDTFSNRNFNEGFEIYMRAGPELRLDGYHRYADKDRISVLFETIPYQMREVKNADIVFTGSPKKNREYREKGINSHFLPQFTRLDKFYHAPREKLKKKVLFVANQWPDFPLRKSVEYAKKSGVELEVFGDNWENSLFGEYAGWWKARQIPNDQLKYFYSSADIVLNDTRPDMIEAGFISNRILTRRRARRLSFPTICLKLRRFTGIRYRCTEMRASLSS